MHSIEFHQGLYYSAVQKAKLEKLRTFVVIDLYQQGYEKEYLLKLVFARRHRNIHLIALKHNLFQQSKHSKTNELNVTPILFKSQHDLKQIGVVGRQMGDRQLIFDAHKNTTQAPFGHLMIEFECHTDAKLKFCSNCSGNGPSVFVSSSNTREKLPNKSTRASYVWIFWKDETNR